MSNFLAGSKVIVTAADEGETYKNGDIFTVLKPNGVGVDVTVKGEKRYLASWEFEAYTEFQIGDTVEVIKSNEEWDYYAGQTGVVSHIDTDEPKVRLEGEGYHFTEDLKLVVEKQTHIKVLATDHPSEYKVGDILEVHEDQRVSDGNIRVVNKHGRTSVVFKGQWQYVAAPVEDEPLAEWEKELLDVTPREIALKDIQKGDTIRAEYTQNGIKHTREGVAHEGFTGWTASWATEEGDYVAHDSWKGATYTILERPEPPKPNPFAEAKVGSIATYGEEGVKYLKTGDDAWSPIRYDGSVPSWNHTNAGMLADPNLSVTYNA